MAQCRYQTCLNMWKGDDGCRAIQTRWMQSKTRYAVKDVDEAICDLDEIFDELVRKEWVMDKSLHLYRGGEIFGSSSTRLRGMLIRSRRS